MSRTRGIAVGQVIRRLLPAALACSLLTFANGAFASELRLSTYYPTSAQGDPDVAASGARMVSEGEFINSRPIADAKLQFLGDAFATPSWLPISNVFSVGDVILLLGVSVLVHVACDSRLVPRRWSPRPAVA